MINEFFWCVKTPKNIVNHKAKTMSHFYSKNTVKVVFQGSKVRFWGAQLHTTPGCLSTQMKVVFLPIINELFDYLI